MQKLLKENNMARQAQGFTIVELLIVIVVIAILASITVVAFNGISARTSNSKIMADVKSYEKLIRSYFIQKGTPPYVPVGNAWVCLGKTADYPAISGWAAGQCYDESGTTYDAYANDTHYADLQTVGTGGSPTFDSVYAGSYRYRGVSFFYWNDYSGGVLAYVLKGNVTCGDDSWFRDYRSSTNTTYCELSFPFDK